MTTQSLPGVGQRPGSAKPGFGQIIRSGLGRVGFSPLGLALFQTATQQFFGMSWINVVPTVIMIVVLLLAPSGIFGSEVKGVQEQ